MLNLPITVARIVTRLAQLAAALFVLCAVALIIIIAIGSTQLSRLQGAIRPLAEQQMRTLLGRDVRIGAVHISGLNGIVFNDVAIAGGKTFADGTAVSAVETRASVNLVSLVLHRGKNPINAVSRITVTTPNMEVARTADGKWDFQDILDHLTAKPGARSGLRAKIVVADGRLTLHDALGLGTASGPTTERLTGIRGSLVSRSGQNYAFLVSARDEARRVGNIQLAGNYAADNGSTRLNVTADDISVNAVTKFLPAGLPITFQNGKAALRMTALFTALPTPGRPISTDKLTAEVDLSGVGLRLQEMSSPIMATSGRLRLVHDRKRYPQGSQLQFINVQARADQIPLTLSGKMTDLNLFDLAHAQPQVDLTLTATGQGPQFQHLFPQTAWLQKVSLTGDTSLVAEVTGKSTDLRIDGTLNNDRAVIRGLELDGSRAAFRLSPGVNIAGKRTSLELTARVKHAVLGESEYHNLQLALTSTTPWKSLEKDVRLQGTASVGEASMPWGAARDIRGKVTVTRDGAQFDEIRAAMFGGEVAAGPLVVPLDTVPGGLVLSAGGSFRDINIEQLTKALKVKDLSGSGDGTFTLTLDDTENLRFTTDLHATRVVYQRKRVNDVTATFRVASRDGTVAIDIPTADAQTEYGHFTIADGSYHRDGNTGRGTLNLPVHGDRVVLNKFYQKLTGSAVLDGAVQGDLSAPVLTAHAIAGNGVLVGRTFTHAESDLVYSAKQLRLRNITFTRDGMSGRVVDTPQGLDPRQSLVGLVATVDLHGAKVDDITSLFGEKSPWQVDGGAIGTVDVRYTDHGLVLAGNATIPDAVVHVPAAGDAYPLQLDKLGLTFTYADRKMQIQDLTLERNDSTIHGAGSAESQVGQPLRADMDFTSTAARLEDMPLDLFHIPIPLNGNAQIAGSLHGVLNGAGPEPMTLNVNITAPQFAAAGLPMQNGDIALQYLRRQGGSELIVNRGTADGAFRAEGAGHFYIDQRRMDGVKLTLTGIDLAKLNAMMRDGNMPVTLTLPDGVAGQGQMAITADGSYARPDLSLGFNLNHLAYGKSPLPDLRGQLHGIVADGHYRLHIDELAAASAGVDVARITGDIDPGHSVDVNVNADNITAKLLAPWVPDLKYDGLLNFAGSVRGPWKNPALDGDLKLANLQYAGRTIPSAGGHLRVDASQLALSDGRVQLLANGAPLQVSGTLPVHWANFRPSLVSDRPLSLKVDLPQQDLAALKPLLPGVKTLTGSVSASLNVAGTPAQPRFNNSWVEVRGDAGFDMGDPGFADSLQNLDLRAAVTGNLQQSTITLEHLSAIVAQSRKGGQAGYLVAGGSVGIANNNLLHPQRWQWNVKANISDVPVSAKLVVVPKATGALQLVSEGSTPVLKGVIVLDHVKLKQPNLGSGASTWGPFAFNPRIQVAVQVGGGVKMSQSIFSVPLQQTPLPFPDLGMTPETTIPPAVSLDAYAPLFSQAGAANEVTGTWATISGTLSDPQLYARFEVDKHELSFPLNLIGSVRHAKGHVTYTKADGPKIVMGIPTFPTAPAPTPVAATSTAPATTANN